MKKIQAHACTWQCRCGTKYSAMSTDPDLHLLPDRFKCWSPLQCRFYFKRNDRLLPGPVVRAITLYEMINGLGNPQERQCGPEDLKKLMLGRKVVAVALEQAADKKRSLITNLTLDNGATIHLAPSTRGVTVYKVTNE